MSELTVRETERIYIERIEDLLVRPCYKVLSSELERSAYLSKIAPDATHAMIGYSGRIVENLWNYVGSNQQITVAGVISQAVFDVMTANLPEAAVGDEFSSFDRSVLAGQLIVDCYALFDQERVSSEEYGSLVFATLVSMGNESVPGEPDAHVKYLSFFGRSLGYVAAIHAFDQADLNTLTYFGEIANAIGHNAVLHFRGSEQPRKQFRSAYFDGIGDAMDQATIEFDENDERQFLNESPITLREYVKPHVLDAIVTASAQAVSKVLHEHNHPQKQSADEEEDAAERYVHRDRLYATLISNVSERLVEKARGTNMEPWLMGNYDWQIVRKNRNGKKILETDVLYEGSGPEYFEFRLAAEEQCELLVRIGRGYIPLEQILREQHGVDFVFDGTKSDDTSDFLTYDRFDDGRVTGTIGMPNGKAFFAYIRENESSEEETRLRKMIFRAGQRIAQEMRTIVSEHAGFGDFDVRYVTMAHEPSKKQKTLIESVLADTELESVLHRYPPYEVVSIFDFLQGVLASAEPLIPPYLFQSTSARMLFSRAGISHDQSLSIADVYELLEQNTENDYIDADVRLLAAIQAVSGAAILDAYAMGMEDVADIPPDQRVQLLFPGSRADAVAIVVKTQSQDVQTLVDDALRLTKWNLFGMKPLFDMRSFKRQDRQKLASFYEGILDGTYDVHLFEGKVLFEEDHGYTIPRNYPELVDRFGEDAIHALYGFMQHMVAVDSSLGGNTGFHDLAQAWRDASVGAISSDEMIRFMEPVLASVHTHIVQTTMRSGRNKGQSVYPDVIHASLHSQDTTKLLFHHGQTLLRLAVQQKQPTEY